MNKTIIFVVGILILIAAAGVIVLQNQNSLESNVVRQDEVIPSGNLESVTKIEGYSGTVLAGKNSPYLEFQKNDYEKALQSGKIVFLNFYANWCPVCRAETSEVQAAFDGLATDQIVGFRVNYNDSDTDEDEKAFAKEFGVVYQHTKVILKNGKQTLKITEQWDKSQFVEALNNALE